MGISCDGVSKVMGYPSLIPDALEMAIGKLVLLDLSINSSYVFRTHKQEFMMFVNRGILYLFWFSCLCWCNRPHQIAREITSGRIFQSMSDSAGYPFLSLR